MPPSLPRHVLILTTTSRERHGWRPFVVVDGVSGITPANFHLTGDLEAAIEYVRHKNCASGFVRREDILVFVQRWAPVAVPDLIFDDDRNTH